MMNPNLSVGYLNGSPKTGWLSAVVPAWTAACQYLLLMVAAAAADVTT
jgi:hypothetical protein